MESDLFNGALPFPVNFTTVAISLAVLLAAIAFVRGVLGMFIGLACMVAGGFIGYSSHGKLPDLLAQISENPSPRFVFFVAVGIGFSCYVMLRLLAGAILLSPLRAGGRKRLVGGPIGAVLSLVPTAGLVLVVGISLRMAGSLFSVEHTDAGVAVEEGQDSAQRPFWARWNEAMDRDYLGAFVSKLDPFATRARGAIANLLVTLKDNAAGGKLAEDPAAGGILRTESLRDLASDPEVLDLIERRDYIALFEHPKLKRAIKDPEIAVLLRDLQIEKAVDGSLYAPEEGGRLRRRVRQLRLFRAEENQQG